MYFSFVVQVNSERKGHWNCQQEEYTVMNIPLIIFLVMLGCCSNVIFLECLTKVHPGCGNLVTFSQFLFIALHGFIFTMRCGKEQSKIPLREYIIMVCLFFGSSVLNNYALNFGIPMPLHMIFKSGSLVANLFMGMVVLRRFYPRHKYAAVALVTVGIILSTIASQSVKSAEKPAVEGPTKAPPSGLDRSSPATLALGVAILTAALLLAARLGIFQEVLYRDYGRHSQQALFITHTLPLPLFVPLLPDIYHHAQLFSQSEPVLLAPFGAVPKLWLLLGCNVVTQYLCISMVFRLTEQCTSLVVTLVVTLRKFASLLFSIWYFSNPFVAQHWLGAALVLAGTLLFTDPCGMFAVQTII
ncbi:UDP-xylose and UDP-N-acetylglucosamine transporter [Amphibalanus amphitrite]|uniref:UDP-xylose and UDP-N-acetylglucosamine transporter n=1 Tax=Amphibalanus amphitrite TaxID=1232801 RepID=A0A6A4VF68_AMPAM|nr:UDP-xylose and UDP-N-acetylglucosamine transporter [Amphibalanus amphitrite]KAF0291809.1 UDP-xylose and UDP-N-acetylglucosamine transporter [Amphibalanus amphitrite]